MLNDKLESALDPTIDPWIVTMVTAGIATLIGPNTMLGGFETRITGIKSDAIALQLTRPVLVSRKEQPTTGQPFSLIVHVETTRY